MKPTLAGTIEYLHKHAVIPESQKDSSEAKFVERFRNYSLSEKDRSVIDGFPRILLLSSVLGIVGGASIVVPVGKRYKWSWKLRLPVAFMTGYVGFGVGTAIGVQMIGRRFFKTDYIYTMRQYKSEYPNLSFQNFDEWSKANESMLKDMMKNEYPIGEPKFDFPDSTDKPIQNHSNVSVVRMNQYGDPIDVDNNEFK